MVVRIGSATTSSAIKQPKLPSKKTLNDSYTRHHLAGTIRWSMGKPREILMGPVVLQKPPKNMCGGSILRAWIPKDDPKKVYFERIIAGGPGAARWSGPHTIAANPYPPGTRYGLVKRANLG